MLFIWLEMKQLLSIFFLVGIGLCVVFAIQAHIRADDTVAIAHEAFDEINEFRRDCEWASLEWDEELAELALQHSQYMNETKQLVHSGYPYRENILLGAGEFPSGSSIVGVWLKSYPHFCNMTGNDITRGAVGIAGKYATFLAR